MVTGALAAVAITAKSTMATRASILQPREGERRIRWRGEGTRDEERVNGGKIYGGEKSFGVLTVGEKSSDVFNFFLTKKFFNKVAARPS